MEQLYKRFVKETFDAEGRLSKFEIFPPENFNFGFDVVDALADKCPEKVGLYWVSKTHEKKTFTFSELRDLTNRTANYFRRLGIRKGDKVMLVLKRHYQFWLSIVALHKLGAVVIPATDQLQRKDYVFRFQAAHVKAVVCTAEGETTAHVLSALSECPTVKILSCVNGVCEGFDNFDEGIKRESADFVRPTGEEGTTIDDVMLMYFTSGTTGYPKMAAHNFAYPLGHIVTAKYWHNVDPDGRHLSVADTGWGKAVWGKLYGQWLCEACVFVYDMERFHADDLLSVISEHKVTTFCAPPTIYRFFIKEDLSKYDLSSIKYATTAGEALNPEVYNKFREITGLRLFEGFGQTETTLVLATLTGTEPKPGSMGKPNPQFDVDLVDENGKMVQPGDVGEIVIHTDKRVPVGLFKEYYENPEKTAESWHDGIYHTGDTAWRDEDGYFWYVGRTDDIIKSSGYRIGPFEIESVIMEHPSVLEVAVTGVPDPIRGQAIKATIVLTRGYAPSEELKKEIQTFVKNATAPYKYPRVVEFVEELPKTISGKIRRVEIRKEKK